MSLNQIINGDIDWTQILLATNLDIPIDRDEFSIPCPLHLDTHASCSINTKKGVWICFAGCGQGSLFTFIQQLLDYDAPRVRKFLKQWGCGTNIYEDLIIPIRDNKSTLVGFVSRRQNTVPKYMYSTGLKKSQLLFGADKVEPSEFVCITEGSLDTMWLQQNGYQSVALLGIHLSVSQAKLLRELPTKEFVLCLDNDKAGQLGREKALWRLKKIAQTSYINIPDPHKDVQDIRDKEHLDKLIQNRYYW
jgi:DNA primase